jgi:hypothetical protein
VKAGLAPVPRHAPACRHKRASRACSLRANARIEAVVRAGRRCWSQGGDERRRPPNRALLLSPRSKRVRPGLGATAFLLAPATAALSQRRPDATPGTGGCLLIGGKHRAGPGSDVRSPLRSSAPRPSDEKSSRQATAPAGACITPEAGTPPRLPLGAGRGSPSETAAGATTGQCAGTRVGSLVADRARSRVRREDVGDGSAAEDGGVH